MLQVTEVFFARSWTVVAFVLPNLAIAVYDMTAEEKACVQLFA